MTKTPDDSATPAAAPDRENLPANEQALRADPNRAADSPGGNMSPPGRFYESKVGETAEPADLDRQIKPSDLSQDIISVEDVLQVANLNDRMELARIRHAQVLAKRKQGTNGQSDTAEKPPLHKETFRTALHAKAPEPAQVPVATVPPPRPAAPSPRAAPADSQIAPAQTSKRWRRAGGFVLAGLALALMFAFAIPGTLRDLVTGVGGQSAELAPQPQAEPTITAGVAVPPVQAGAQGDPLPGASDQVSTFAPAFSAAAKLPQAGDFAQLPVDATAPAALSAPINLASAISALRPPFRDAAPSPLLGRIVPNYVVPQGQEPAGLAEQSRTTETVAVPAGDGPLVSDVFDLSPAPLEFPGFANLTQTPTRFRTVAKSRAVALSAVLSSGPEIALRQPDVIAPQSGFASTQPVSLGTAPAADLDNSTQLPNLFLAPLGPGPAARPSPPPTRVQIGIRSSSPPSSASPNGENQFVFSSLLVNAPANLPKANLDGIVASLRENGFPAGSPRTVNFIIRNTNVRYFYPADAAAAQALSALVGGVARDFTSFRPKPPVGTVEVFLAGNASLRTTAGTAPPPQTAEERAVIELRNRLIEGLQRGDHL